MSRGTCGQHREEINTRIKERWAWRTEKSVLSIGVGSCDGICRLCVHQWLEQPTSVSTSYLRRPQIIIVKLWFWCILCGNLLLFSSSSGRLDGKGSCRQILLAKIPWKDYTLSMKHNDTLPSISVDKYHGQHSPLTTRFTLPAAVLILTSKKHTVMIIWHNTTCSMFESRRHHYSEQRQWNSMYSSSTNRTRRIERQWAENKLGLFLPCHRDIHTYFDRWYEDTQVIFHHIMAGSSITGKSGSRTAALPT